MRYYIAFDDTDTADSDRGTGKLARWFADELSDDFRLWGVLRQQLPRFADIPYTSNNSSACVVVDTERTDAEEALIALAESHIRKHFIEGSDPGLCVAEEEKARATNLEAFGRECCVRRVAQEEAMAAAGPIHLSGHGGTNDGIIGAAAAVGLTRYGWSGRFVAFGAIRELPDSVPVGLLEENGIRVLSTERDALLPALTDLVETQGWLRPRLWGGRPVLPVERTARDRWLASGIKRPGRPED